MNHLIRLFTDLVLDFYDAVERIQNLFRKKPEPSLVCFNIDWCTQSEWMDRLVAYKHMDIWTADK